MSEKKKRTKIAPILDLDTAAYLNIMYASPAQLPLEKELVPPPSPGTTIDKAGEFLLREQRKGFISNFDPVEYKKSLLRPSVVTKANVQPLSAENLVKAESYQEFWINTRTVRTTMNDIETLPFIIKQDIQVIKGKYLEAIASIVRVMKHDGYLETNKMTKAQLTSTMRSFVEKARQSRHDVLIFTLEGNFLDMKDLPQWLIDECNDSSACPKPVESSIEKTPSRMQIEENELQRGVEKKLLDHISEKSRDIPQIYRLSQMSNDAVAREKTFRQTARLIRNMPKIIIPAMSNSSRPQDSEKIDIVAPLPETDGETGRNFSKTTTRLITVPIKKMPKPPVIPIPQSPPKEITKMEAYQMYWNDEDPLKRIEPPNPLKAIKDSSQPLTIEKHDFSNVDVKMPFTLTSREPQSDNLILREGIWNTADLIGRENDGEEEEEDEEKIVAKRNRESILRDQSEIMRYMENMEEPEKSGKEDGADIFIKLQKVWDQLGFSIRQKLDLVLKYTKTVEDSQRLKEALNCWELTFDVVQLYQSSYTNIKDFIKLEAKTTKRAKYILNQMKSELTAHEQSLIQISSHLKTAFDDDLIVHRHSVQELIEMRQNKVAKMLIDNDLLFDDED